MNVALAIFIYTLAYCCFFLAFKKRWGKKGGKPYVVPTKVKVISGIVGVLLFVLGVYLT
jgi:hypothetical protein